MYIMIFTAQSGFKKRVDPKHVMIFHDTSKPIGIETSITTKDFNSTASQFQIGNKLNIPVTIIHELFGTSL